MKPPTVTGEGRFVMHATGRNLACTKLKVFRRPDTPRLWTSALGDAGGRFLQSNEAAGERATGRRGSHHEMLLQSEPQETANLTGNHPAPREIAPGKILLAECGDPAVTENRARCEIVEEAPPHAGLPGRGSIHGNIRLVWSSPGFEIAGSVMIWTNGYWAVWYAMANGSRHGRRYRPDAEGEAKARTHFRRLTTEQS